MPLARALLLSVAALALATHAEPAAVVARASCCTTQTLHLGTNGSPSGPTKLVYSCSQPASVCGPEIAPPGRWTQTLTVPVGTLVWLQVETTNPEPSGATPDCWISDEAGRVLQSGHGVCSFQAPQLPPPPAQPSS